MTVIVSCCAKLADMARIPQVDPGGTPLPEAKDEAYVRLHDPLVRFMAEVFDLYERREDAPVEYEKRVSLHSEDAST